MDTGNEANDYMEHTSVNDFNGNVSKERISPREIVEDLKLFKGDRNLKVFEKYILTLMEEDFDVAEIEKSSYIEDLNECMGYITNYIFGLTDKINEQIVFRKFLILLAEKKLNISQKEKLEAFDLRLSVINNGCILAKLCVENNYNYMIEYFINQIFKELDVLEKDCDRTPFVHKYVLQKRTQISMYNIEKKAKENKLDEVVSDLQEQKECVMNFKQYREYFVSLCYNIGLKCNRQGNHFIALRVLLLAYEVCKIESLTENMIIVLRLLVSLCLKYNPNENWKHAIDALDLADGTKTDLFFVIAKIKLALIVKDEIILEEALNQATEWDQIKMEHINEIINLLQKNEHSVRAAEFIRNVRCKCFPNTDKFLLMKLEIQIYITENDRRVFSLVNNAIEMIKKSDIPQTSIHSMYKLLATEAGIKFKAKMLKDSLIWYNYCVEMCEVSDLDISLLDYAQIRMCLCYFELNEWNSAKQCYQKLKRGSFGTDPLHVYLALQIGFMSNDEKLIEDALNTYDDGSDKIGEVLISCCQRALSSGKKDILFKILEDLLLKYQTQEGSLLKAKFSQCLIGLCINQSGDEVIKNKCMLYMDKALDVLQKNPEHPETEELSQWFSRVAWNVALTPDLEAKYMFEFFLRCCCFCEISLRNLNRLKNALMLAAASGLHVARHDLSDKEAILECMMYDDLSCSPKEKNLQLEKGLLEQKHMLLFQQLCLSGVSSLATRKVTTVIEKCKSLETGSNVSLLRLLYLYEFETKCHTKKLREGVESLKEALNLPFMDVKTLQHIAAIVHEFAPRNHEIVMESLKVAVQKILESQDEKSLEASKTFHSLIQVMFYVQEYLSPSVEEENLLLCKDLLKFIEDQTFNNYSQLEILWVMTKCWNWGIQKLAQNDSKRAYKWCSLAMGFLQKLESLKTLHETKLNDMYAAYFPEQKEVEQ